MTDIIRSESSFMEHSRSPEDRFTCEEFGRAERRNAAAADFLNVAPRSMLSSTRSTKESNERHSGLVAHDRNMLKSLPLIPAPNSFQESPEWRQYYDQSSKPAKTEQRCAPIAQSKSLPEHSSMNTNGSLTEAVISANTLLSHAAMNKAGLDSRKLLRLPRSRSSQNILKAGNMRLKQLIRPKHNACFRTEAVAGAAQDTAGQLRKRDFVPSKKDLNSRDAKARSDRFKREAITLPQSLRNKESSTSILDLDEVEARHGLEKYHRSTLSKSWDEIFESVGGFKSISDSEDDELGYNEAQSHFTGVGVTKPVPPVGSTSGSHHRVNTPENVEVKEPHVPAPCKLNIIKPLEPSPTRQGFKFLITELPARPTPTRPTPTRQSKTQYTNQGDGTMETDRKCMQAKASLTPQLREARSFEGLSKSGSAPNTSQSTIALEAIEAEMNNGQPLSSSTLMGPALPFSLNCTPPQPIVAPTDPPAGPLPELPEEFRKAGAPSNTLPHHSNPAQLARPTISPGLKHRKTTSANSSGSNATLPAIRLSQSYYRAQTSLDTRSLKQADSLSNARSVLAVETSDGTCSQRKSALAGSERVKISSFDRYNLGSSQDLQSLPASKTDLTS